MKKLIITIVLLLATVVNAEIINNDSHLRLWKIDFTGPSQGLHALYIDIYGVTNVPNCLLTIKGTNVVFDSRLPLLTPYSSTPYFYPSTSAPMVLITQGTLTYSPFHLMSRLMYTTSSLNYSIELITARPFTLGQENYNANETISMISVPEPTTLILSFSGFLILFYMRKDKYDYERNQRVKRENIS